MLQAYSINSDVAANSFVTFDNVSLQKGCTVTKSGESSFALNKCGVYCVSVDASAEATTTLQLYKNGVALPQAQSTGGTPGFKTFIQVDHNNSNCPCSSADIIQVFNITATTLTNANITISKLV